MTFRRKFTLPRREKERMPMRAKRAGRMYPIVRYLPDADEMSHIRAAIIAISAGVSLISKFRSIAVRKY